MKYKQMVFAGFIYGFIVTDTGKWTYVLNMEGKYPEEPMPNFY